MERELAELKESVARTQDLRGHGERNSFSNGPRSDLLQGHDLRGVACGPQGNVPGGGHT